MKVSIGRTLAATLIATGAGIGVWFFGVSKAIWPTHPQIAAFVITIVVGVVVTQIWPAGAGQKRI